MAQAAHFSDRIADNYLGGLRYNAKLWSLKALPVDLGMKPMSVAIITLKNRTVSPVVQLFVEQVRAAAKEHR